MPAAGPAPLTPLERLHDTAARAGIVVVDAIDNDGPLLDDETAAFVACGECIGLSPRLDDDGLRADVLAMALALAYAMGPCETEHAGDITSAGSFVLISRIRVAEPSPGPGMRATEIAREHGSNTTSAAFEYTAPLFELARHDGESALVAAGGVRKRSIPGRPVRG